LPCQAEKSYTGIDMKRQRLLTLTCFAFFFLCGFFVNVGGAVSGALADRLGTTTAVVGYCFSAFMIGRVIGILGNGILVHRPPLGLNLYVRLAPLLCLAAVGCLWLTKSVGFLAAALLVSGAAVGWLYSLANIILVDAHPGPEKTAYIAVMNFLFSVGGVTSPFLAGILLKGGFGWNYPYLAFGALTVVALGLTAGADYRGLLSGSERGVADEGGLGGRQALLCAAIVMYILAEYSISYWTPVYLREARGKDPLFSGACVSAFWMAILAGRFLHAFLIRKIRPRRFIVASGALAAAAALLFAFARTDALVVASVLLSGLGCAGLFPSLYALGIDASASIKKSFPTLLMLSAASGSFLAMPSGSVVKTAAGIVSVPFIPAIALTLMCLLVVASGRKKKAG
jgi:fucose permease